MSTRKIATALGAAVLLLGAPASYALAGQERPDRPAKEKQCSNGVDDDGDGDVDGGDAGCGSANDNDESDETAAEEPGGGTPALPELPPTLPELPPGLPELPPGLPELPPGLPELPPGGGELPEPPPAPADPAALIAEVVTTVQATVDAVLTELPPPPGQ